MGRWHKGSEAPDERMYRLNRTGKHFAPGSRRSISGQRSMNIPSAGLG